MGEVAGTASSAFDWAVANASTLLAGAVVLLGFWLLLNSRPAKRVYAAIEQTMLSNWRLALLGATGVVLSAASGYTTWDGMRHFTGDAVLSGMITFGIQGVMLIIAWVIGESFATGMSQRTAHAPSTWTGLSCGRQAVAGGVLGVILFITLAALLMPDSGSGALMRSPQGGNHSDGFGHRLLILGAGLVFAALIALYSASDLVRPYLQGSRLVIRNAMLWLMFLACMATSVFFSFDSLFSAIFPQAERVRAAELRAQNQVAGIVADIGVTISDRRVAAADELFRSQAWSAYDAQLTSLAREAQTAQGEIEKVFNEQLEARNRGVKEQQERIVTAQSGQAGLSGKKAALADELERLKGERPTLAAELAQKKTDLDNRAKEIDAKRVEAIAEDKGIEGTGKEGKGPVWRQRRAELARLQDYYAVGEERVKDAQRRLGAADARIVQIERELSAADGELARFKGEAETAEERIRLLGQGLSGEGSGRVDPGRVLGAFEAARAEFRRDPTAERLTALQHQCASVYGAMLAAPAARERVAGIDCDPKHAAEAAALVFALNGGEDAFARTCAGAERIGRYTTADALFAFARACLADSALPSRETEQLRGAINFVELNRDDKAHRFVVTINAFNDGNRLAYLALGIALAIDSLIFMSGLFGANAVRSPLSDVPSFKARNAQQLEAIVENALLPDTFENARLALHAMRPITNAVGFMAEVRLARLDPHAADGVLAILNAGATIHAVEYDEDRDRYLVRSELFEFLSLVAKRAFETSKQHVTTAELEKIVTVALLPDVREAVEAVLQHLHPINETDGFTSELLMPEVERDNPGVARSVRSVLNAGATLKVVQRDGAQAGRYLVHGDLYKALARIRARALAHGGAARGGVLHVVEGGGSERPALVAEERRQITHHAPTPAPVSTRPGDEAVRAGYRDALLAELGLGARAVEARLASAEAERAAFAAWKKLNLHAGPNPKLASFVRGHQDEVAQRLKRAFDRLQRQIGADPHKLELLNEADTSVQRLLPVLVMFPEIGLVGSMVDGLERGAQHDGGEHEQELLERLRRVRDVLGGDLGTARAWAEIGEHLEVRDGSSLQSRHLN